MVSMCDAIECPCRLKFGPVTATWNLFFKVRFPEISAATTLPETNSSHLKMDGWKDEFRLCIFRGYVSFRECTKSVLSILHT